MEARDERRLLRLQKQMANQKPLIIDELGFVPLSKTGAELLFELISQRYERGSMLITSNLPFDEWTEVFGSERLTGALLDRLTQTRQHPREPSIAAPSVQARWAAVTAIASARAAPERSRSTPDAHHRSAPHGPKRLGTRQLSGKRTRPRRSSPSGRVSHRPIGRLSRRR